jgi:bifunctional UDP-N-acetylglucosamine pyrophosphorylase/glucosamine-1-phosphate N-acetyltransferase
MKSNLPKVLHLLGGKPMVDYSIRAAAEISGRPPVLVIGHGAEQVKAAVGDAAQYAVQPEQLGTGHAVMQTQNLLQGQADQVIVMYADMPLIRPQTLNQLVEMQKANKGPLSLITIEADQPRGFGRIVRDQQKQFKAIVEEAVATADQLAITEVNAGIYCFDADWLWPHLDQIKVSPKGEYYLTDLPEMAVAEGHVVGTFLMDDPDEGLGINTRVHLAEAEAVLRKRINTEAMLSGVTIVDPQTTYIDLDVQIGADTVIHPNSYLRGNTVIGEGCTIGPNTVIEDSTIGNSCTIKGSVVEMATLEDHVDVGPFGHLRKGAYLESGVHMGNFGEVKNSRLRKGVKMGHFSYVGDGDIGDETNIGAGTITCNYDGVNKFKTIVGKNVFIGSDTMLVAPLTLGDNARTGAGSVVTRDVPPGGLVYGVPARPPSTSKQQE